MHRKATLTLTGLVLAALGPAPVFGAGDSGQAAGSRPQLTGSPGRFASATTDGKTDGRYRRQVRSAFSPDVSTVVAGGGRARVTARAVAAAGAKPCALGSVAVVRRVMAIEGQYRFSSFGGSLGGRSWAVCQYVSGSLAADKPTSLSIGVFPFATRISDSEWTLGGVCTQAFLTAVQARPRACALLRGAQKATSPAQKERLLFKALSQVGDVARTRVSGSPAFFYSPSKSPGSDAWVYVPARGTLVHAHCIRATNPELRAGDCVAEGVRIVVKALGPK